MATISTINIGNIVNDGLGDDLRTAFQKVNANFSSLNSALTVTASNLGDTGESVFKQIADNNLEFRKLVAGNKISLTTSVDNILISSTAPAGFNRITTNNGYVSAEDGLLITVQGDPDIQVTANQGTGVITVGTVLDLNQILQVLDFGPVNGAFTNIVQMNTAAANIDFGTFVNPSLFNIDLGTFN
jgi:hypothetical protein